MGEQARLAERLDEAETLFRRALTAQPLSLGAAMGLGQTAPWNWDGPRRPCGC